MNTKINKYKVLHVINSMNRGGAETFIMNLYNSINTSNLQFDFLVTMNNNAYEEEILNLGGKIYKIESRNQGYIKYIKHLYIFFKQHGEKYRSIHVHTSSLSNIEPLIFAKIFKIKNRIIHSHNTFQDGLIHRFLHYINKPFIHFFANKYLACSENALKWLYKNTFIKDKAIIINNGIDINKFQYNENIRTEIRKQMQISEKIVIGHVGRFSKVKNHEFLIDIFYELTIINPYYHLVLVGCGELERKIYNKISKLGISDYVTILGPRPDVNNVLQAFDYFVFPSLFEGLPVALIEAQCSGLVCFCSNTISNEVNITNLCHFLSLNKSPQEWAIYISKTIYKRSNTNNKIIEYGYDINSVSYFIHNNIYI